MEARISLDQVGTAWPRTAIINMEQAPHCRDTFEKRSEGVLSNDEQYRGKISLTMLRGHIFPLEWVGQRMPLNDKFTV